MLIEYMESLFGTYVPVENAAGIDSINWTWVSFAFLFISLFHCVMRLIAVVLRRVLSK